ncbi:Hypothetical predicted protein [Cloeon dipterum]|uniref:Protein krueppel n=1 Tax=Cloeon dipterum TaxID=197152 RepID=A0A8S1CFI0_9INSE|nr:Hypothetical predicted protein [Cloeon dipterum]
MAKLNEELFCSVQTCRFHLPVDPNDLSLQHLLFYYFPEDEYMRGLWGEKCGINPTPGSRICSMHFADHDFETNHSEFLNYAPKKVLKKDAVPSVNLPSSLLCGTVVILNQQIAGTVPTVSVVSHRDWSLDKNLAEGSTLKLHVNNTLISNSKPAEIWELCRMCAGTCETMIPIFNDDGTDKDNIALKLKHSFSINASPTDTLPLRICAQCLVDLNFCYQTALRCAEADATFRCWLVEAESVDATQDDGNDWQLHDEVSTEISETARQGWQRHDLGESWNRVEEVQQLHEVNSTHLSISETELLKEKGNETVLEEPEMPQTQPDCEEKNSVSSKDDVVKKTIEVVEKLENVPLRDRLRNKGRKKLTSHVKIIESIQSTKERLSSNKSQEEFQKQEVVNNIPCSECKELFLSLNALKSHNESAHSNLKSPFVCLECGQKFISKATLRVHMKNHTGKKITVCEICGKTFRTCDALRQHKFVHMTDEEKKSVGFPCTMCDKKFSRRTKLEYHMRRHTGERRFICTICSKSFHDSVRLKAHTERHSTEKKFKCDECGSGFVCKRYLTNHKSRYHRRREVFRCCVCAVVLSTAEEAMVHHRSHTSEEVAKSGTTNPYTQSFDHHCRQCCEYFPSKELLNAHKAKAHVRGRSAKVQSTVDIAELIKQVDCTVCGKKLWGVGSLKRHMSSAHASSRPERIFQCEFCAKMFAQKAQLVVHIRTHTGERPHRCSFCSKGFITGQSLIKHERIHTGETPFHCTQCPKAFRSKENLILHQKTHLGLKPFECHYCQKSFGRQIHLQLHLRTHTGERPYACDVCGRAFAQGGDMRRHKLTHTGERAYKCSVCSFSSNKRKTLRDHEASAHGKRQEVAAPLATFPMPPVNNNGSSTMTPYDSQQLAPTEQQNPVLFLSNSDLQKNWGDN